MCTTTDFESDNPKQPATINLPTTLSRLLECRQKDMATYDELDELAVKVHEAHANGQHALLSELLTKACDLEYGLLCDCDVFGDLAQQWRVDDTKGEAMYIVPEPVLQRWDWILANAPAPERFAWSLDTKTDEITLKRQHSEHPQIYRIPTAQQSVQIPLEDADNWVALTACLSIASICPTFAAD